MSNDFTALPVSQKLIDALEASVSDDDRLLHVKPPRDSDGMDESIELMKSFHMQEVEGRLFSRNESRTCGMEIWYEDEEVQFVFYVPDDELENHYRRQLSGHFPGVEIENKVKSEDKFLEMEEDEYIATTRMQLDHHYFEPVRSPVSETDELKKDPYQTILSAIDSKDENRVMIQMLYKPAEDDWTELHHNNVESHAQSIKEKGGVKTRWFGLKIDEVERPQDQDRAAKQIRSQVAKPGYYVNLRIAIVSDSKESAEKQLQSITNMYKLGYREVTKQQFVPKIWNRNVEQKSHDLLLNMAKRQGDYMSQPKNPLSWLYHKATPNCDTMIMTIPELAGLAHIPSGDEVDVDGITWTDVPVSGTLPPDAKKFQPVDPETAKQAAAQGATPPATTGDAETPQPTDGEGDSADPEYAEGLTPDSAPDDEQDETPATAAAGDTEDEWWDEEQPPQPVDLVPDETGAENSEATTDSTSETDS